MAKIEIAIEVKQGLNCGNCERWQTINKPPFEKQLCVAANETNSINFYAPAGLYTKEKFYCNEHKPKK